ncbi:MAG TPA: hypothetical protein VFB14_17375 [Bryobacteraceae bacterium]|jgi:hypothetical protein|nr:hypothetical protein [Bryobacteraceae bacterium]
MGLTAVKSESLTGEPGEPDVRQELDRIVASRVFRGSHRCQAFLQYVVTKTLEGEGQFLKERTLAVHVFGREATDDLSDDSIVRVGAREVRKRLAQYYIDEGANDPLRIELPAGSYIPSFQWRAAAPVSDAEIAPPPDPSRTRLHANKYIVGAAMLAACLIAIIVGRAMSAPRSAFDSFWQPAFAGKAPLTIGIAHPIVYLPSLRAQRLDEERNGYPNPPIQRPLNVPPDLLNGSDFSPIVNQFVGVGDAETAIRVSSLFTLRHAVPRVRLASRLDFNDLRSSGTVLIGAYTNRWTMDLTRNMRYRFEYNAAGKPCIAEGAVGCRWTLTTKADDGRSPEDYILLCRLPHSVTNRFIVVCAGLNVYGTEEAGRIISDPDSLTPILRQLPRHWADRNLEIVLHLAVVGDAPAQSEVVSVYSW